MLDAQKMPWRGLLLFGLSVALLHSTIIFAYLVKSNSFDSPPAKIDGLIFELIANQLWRHNTFAIVVDEEALSAYAPFNKSGEYENLFSGEFTKFFEKQGEHGITTGRPPLYPFCLSQLYRIFGRHFCLGRIFNTLCIAVGTAFIVCVSLRVAGVIPAVITAVLAFCDPMLLSFSRALLSEALGYLGVGILFALVGLAPSSPRNYRPVMIGVCLGCLMLARTVFVLWFAAILLAYLIVEWGNSRPQELVRRIGVIVVVAFLFVGPWWLRNVKLLDAFMPLGAQGGMVVGILYNDKVFERYGSWTDEGHVEFIDSYAGTETGIKREKALAEHGYKLGRSWIEDNLNALPKIAFLRVYSLWWKDATFRQRFLAVLSILGILFLFKRREGFVAVVMLLAHTLAIAMSSSVHGGRFLFSLHPVLLFLAAFGIYGLGSLPVRRIPSLVRRELR